MLTTGSAGSGHLERSSGSGHCQMLSVFALGKLFEATSHPQVANSVGLGCTQEELNYIPWPALSSTGPGGRSAKVSRHFSGISLCLPPPEAAYLAQSL